MHMCMHACLSVCVLLYVYVLVCMCVYMCVHICVCVFYWMGGSLGAALCLSHLPPHSTDTQGNGRKGGEFILEKGIGVQWSNGQQCRFY